MLRVGKHFWALVYSKNRKKSNIKKGELVEWEEGYFIGETMRGVWAQWREHCRNRHPQHFSNFLKAENLVEVTRLVIMPGIVAGELTE